MRLINVQTLELRAFSDSEIPQYAILSHTWEAEEISFQEMTNPTDETPLKRGYKKIVSACLQADKDEHEWIWIDTCCIDKTSSAELSEAINSMWRYYKRAAVCYVYLQDVKSEDVSEWWWHAIPRHAVKWFSRGWTLQELIAPPAVQFYTNEWRKFGSRIMQADHIEALTGVPKDVLSGRASHLDYSIAQRMSWASQRQTTRVEDQAYCLLGKSRLLCPMSLSSIGMVCEHHN